MTYTTNYNMNIVEGTDIVNPMSVDNPNYQTIDSVMYANECNAIGSATELKTGTVHALSRVKANQNVFRFRATSRYVSGDTFTVDGNVVTAQLPDGSALADGAYIIGSDVLCALVGSQLTLYVSINNAEQIMYDQNTSVKQKIDGLSVSDIEYSSGVTLATELTKMSADNVGSKGIGNFDADACFEGGIYRNVSSISHAPSNDSNGVLLVFPTFAPSEGLKTCVQMYVQVDSTLWIRLNWGATSVSWTAWSRVSP